MRNLEARFEALVAKIRALPADGPTQPSQRLKLRLYGLYRQAKDGDVQGDKPGAFDLVAKFKYDAWANCEGMSRDAAMKQYVNEVEAFAEDHGVEI